MLFFRMPLKFIYPYLLYIKLVFWLVILLNLKKNPDRFPPRVNNVTKQMTQETRTYRDH